jgi:hypothetical protein
VARIIVENNFKRISTGNTQVIFFREQSPLIWRFPLLEKKKEKKSIPVAVYRKRLGYVPFLP